MLEDTYERHILDKMFADERVGLYVIRGENLVLLGEVDLQKDAAQTAMQEVPLEVLLKEKAARRQLRVRRNEVSYVQTIIENSLLQFCTSRNLLMRQHTLCCVIHPDGRLNGVQAEDEQLRKRMMQQASLGFDDYL
jgi:hypothetical protein